MENEKSEATELDRENKSPAMVIAVKKIFFSTLFPSSDGAVVTDFRRVLTCFQLFEFNTWWTH